MTRRLLEALGPQQRYQQVGGEAGEGEREQDEVEAHGSGPLAGDEIEGEHGEAGRSEGQHQKIVHVGLQALIARSPGRCGPVVPPWR